MEMTEGITMMNMVRLTMLLGVTTCGFGQDAVVQKSTIWVDTVKRGDMTRAVRGRAVLVRGMGEVSMPAAQAQEIKPGQPADIDTRKFGIVVLGNLILRSDRAGSTAFGCI